MVTRVDKDTPTSKERGLALVTALLLWFLFVAIAFYLLWNWLAPAIFGLPDINFLQAIGLISFIPLLTSLSFSR